METRAKAPRIHAFIKKTHGRSVIAMPRDDWEALQVKSTNLVQIDIQETPLARVAEDSCVLAAVAQKYGPSDGRVSVYRYDEKDPKPVNVDHYSVWLDLVGHPRIQEMVQAASTSLDDNLCRFSKENVFLVLEHLGDDHWLADLPSSVISICINST
jgi:hypothetical protein